MNVHVICGSSQRCGFRVDSGYFARKTRFAPGICPGCNGPLSIVEAYTENVVQGSRMVLGPNDVSGRSPGTIVSSESEKQPSLPL